MTLLAIQAIGLLAALVGVMNVQMKHRKKILLITIIAATLWTTHFLLLGAITGAALNVAGMVIVSLFYAFDRTRPSWLLGLAVAIIVGTGLLAWRDWLSIMPIIGMVFATFAFWQKDEQRIRQLLIVTSLFWLSYNVIVLSYVGAGKEVVAIISASIALWRYRKVDESTETIQEIA